MSDDAKKPVPATTKENPATKDSGKVHMGAGMRRGPNGF